MNIVSQLNKTFTTDSDGNPVLSIKATVGATAKAENIVSKLRKSFDTSDDTLRVVAT